MYNELYAAWQREIDDPTLGGIASDFYAKIAEYLRRIKEEDKVLDKKSVKMNLLFHESVNVERMLKELLGARYRKIIKTVTKNQKLPTELLRSKKPKCAKALPSLQKLINSFRKISCNGQIPESVRVSRIKLISNPKYPHTHKRSTIRFIKGIPAIMGADMKSYGPFVADDVASLPPQNAQILVKQGLAVLVDVS